LSVELILIRSEEEEDIIADPMKQIKRIYSQLKLPGIQKALPEMQKYLKRQSEYKTNKYTIDNKDRIAFENINY